jgi:hypothetical protein
MAIITNFLDIENGCIKDETGQFQADVLMPMHSKTSSDGKYIQQIHNGKELMINELDEK